jgi:serine/threonine protein kinase
MANWKNIKYEPNIEKIYEIGSVLGEGSFGTVNRCTRKAIGNDVTFAIKTIRKRSLHANENLPKLMKNELTILQQVSHPHIMAAKEILEDDQNYYIITEMLEGGELFDRLIKLKNFSEKKAAYIVKQIALALNYMHKKNIAHRDLKPENVLLESDKDNNLELKIADFGFSCFFDP